MATRQAHALATAAVAAVQARLDAADSATRQALEERNAALAREAALQAENAALRAEIDRLTALMAQMQAEIDTLQVEIDALRFRVESLMAEIADLKDEVTRLHQEMAALQLEVERLAAAMELVRAELAEARRTLQELRSQPPVEVRIGGLNALFGPEGRWRSVETVEGLSALAAEALAYLGATGVCGGTLAAMVYDPDEDPDVDGEDDPTTYDDNMLQLVAWHAPAAGGAAADAARWLRQGRNVGKLLPRGAATAPQYIAANTRATKVVTPEMTALLAADAVMAGRAVTASNVSKTPTGVPSGILVQAFPIIPHGDTAKELHNEGSLRGGLNVGQMAGGSRVQVEGLGFVPTVEVDAVPVWGVLTVGGGWRQTTLITIPFSFGGGPSKYHVINYWQTLWSKPSIGDNCRGPSCDQSVRRVMADITGNRLRSMIYIALIRAPEVRRRPYATVVMHPEMEATPGLVSDIGFIVQGGGAAGGFELAGPSPPKSTPSLPRVYPSG